MNRTDAPVPEPDLDERLADVDAAQLRALVGTLLRSAPIGIAVFDADLRYLFVNEALAEINGVPAADHLGRSMSEVLPDLSDDAVAPFREILETGEPVLGLLIEGETPAQPGVTRSWMESVYRVRLGDGTPGLAAIVVETTEQRRSERRIRRVIDTLVGFVGLLAPDGTVLEANESALVAAGLHPEDIVGQPVWETPWWKHEQEDPERLKDGIRRAAAGERVRFDACVKVGSRFLTLDLQLAALVEEGRVTAVVASGVDITQRRSATRRLRALGDFSHSLALADTSAAVADAVLEHLPAALDADFVTLALVNEADQTVSNVTAMPFSPEMADRYRTLPLDARTPLTDAVRERRIVIVESSEDSHARYPEMAPDVEDIGLVAVAAAPLLMDHECYGAIGFGWHRELHDEDAMDSRLLVVAELTAQTLQRTRTADARAQLVAELYRHLVPEQPQRPSLEIAVRYQAAGRSIGFGGDWYDVVPLDGDTTAVVVGDVAGHGIHAAARMAVLRTALSTVIRTGTPIDEVFDTTEPLVEHLDSAFLGSAVVAVVEPSRGTLTYSSAGHPPMLVRPPGGTTGTLEDAIRPVLGAGRRSAVAAEVALEPGSVVVAYTDGLVEGRREHLDTALARLRAALDDAPADVSCEELADLLLATGGASADLTDDVVLVVLRVDPALAGERLATRAASAYPPSVDSVGAARRWAAERCREWDAEHVVHVVELVVDELVANAVLHAGTDVEITLRRDGDALIGTVHDHAAGEVELKPADAERIGGWGLQLVSGLTTDWHVTHDGGGKTVHFTVPIPPPGQEP